MPSRVGCARSSGLGVGGVAGAGKLDAKTLRKRLEVGQHETPVLYMLLRDVEYKNAR